MRNYRVPGSTPFQCVPEVRDAPPVIDMALHMWPYKVRRLKRSRCADTLMPSSMDDSLNPAAAAIALPLASRSTLEPRIAQLPAAAYARAFNTVPKSANYRGKRCTSLE
jgi:hypothetical protein